jgi:hypothetical protein
MAAQPGVMLCELQAFAHHFAIEQDLKKHESQWDCVDHNVSGWTLLLKPAAET